MQKLIKKVLRQTHFVTLFEYNYIIEEIIINRDNIKTAKGGGYRWN